MTTADIMLAQSGNTESFRDHEYDARTILWALLAAIVIHLAVAFLLAAFSGVFSPTIPFEEKPAELTLMDLSPASLVPKNSAFIETDESKKAPEPKEKTFESNANSIGASELAAAGCLCHRKRGRIARLWILRQIRIRWKQREPNPSRRPLPRNRNKCLLRNLPRLPLPSNLRC